MRYNVPKSCAALLSPRGPSLALRAIHLVPRPSGGFLICVAVMYLTLRTGCERYGRKNPLPYPFSERSHIGNLRQIRKQGKGRSPKRKENRRLSFLFAHRGGRRNVPAVRRRRIPPLRFREKLSARNGRTRLRSSRTPVRRCRKRSCTVRPNPLTQFEHPSQPVQESAGFHRDKNFQENMRYPLAKYAKIGYYIQALFCMNSRMMLNDVKNTIIWRHSDYDRR